MSPAQLFPISCRRHCDLIDIIAAAGCDGGIRYGSQRRYPEMRVVAPELARDA